MPHAEMILITLAMTIIAMLPDTMQTQQMETLEVDETAKHRFVRATVPAQVLDSRDLQRLGITGMNDALSRLAGITLRDYGGAGGMTTISVRGLGAKHTGVSYDGLLLSDCQSGEINVAHYSLDNVHRLAFTIGEDDDIFVPARQASVPALLSLSTIAPPTDDLSPHIMAQMRAGSFGYISPYLRYGQNLNDRLAIALQGDFIHADNQYPFTLHNGTLTTREHRVNSRMNAGHGEGSFIWQVTPRHRLSGKAYWYDNDRQLPGQVRYYTNVSREMLREQNAFGQLNYQGRLNEVMVYKSSARFNWNSSDYRDPLYSGGVRDAHYWQREHYITSSLLYTPRENWSVSFAADYAFANLNSTLATDRRPYRHSLLQTASAKWHTDRITVVGRLLHSLYLNGARFGDGSRDMNRLSPSLSASFRLLRHHELYARASYKNIFRAPTFNENYFFHYGSTDLHPETTDQINVGLTWRQQLLKGCDLQLTADGYLNHVRDKILAVPVNMFIWRCINLGRVRVWGFDATARSTYKLSRHHTLLFAANYSLQRATNRTNTSSPYYGYQLAYVPLHTGGAAVSWENPWVNLSIHGEGTSHRFTTNEHYSGTRVAGYFEWTATAYRTFRLKQHTIELRAEVKNLFDRQYEIVRLYPMPGRSYMFTIKYQL